MYKNSILILGVKIFSITFDEGLEEVRKWLLNDRKKHYIVTPNPEFLIRAQKDLEFKKILNGADLALPDSAGLIWASKVLKKPIKEKVAGADFMLGLCKMAEREGFKIGLIGGGRGVAVKTGECLKKMFPRLKVGLASEEWPFDYVLHQTVQDFAQGKPIDILFVAFGAPKQEKWIAENLPNIPVRVAMGVGGSFDYIAEVVLRAPKLLRDLGLEWLFRLILQPWRFFRQLTLIKFVFLVLREKFFS